MRNISEESCKHQNVFAQ